MTIALPRSWPRARSASRRAWRPNREAGEQTRPAAPSRSDNEPEEERVRETASGRVGPAGGAEGSATIAAWQGDATVSTFGRVTQLVVGIICMVMIANLQYGWTLFVSPIDEKHHWGRAAIQVAF